MTGIGSLQTASMDGDGDDDDEEDGTKTTGAKRDIVNCGSQLIRAEVEATQVGLIRRRQQWRWR